MKKIIVALFILLSINTFSADLYRKKYVKKVAIILNAKEWKINQKIDRLYETDGFLEIYDIRIEPLVDRYSTHSDFTNNSKWKYPIENAEFIYNDNKLVATIIYLVRK